MLTQEIGSIINYMNLINPVKIYIDEIPKNMIIPSMYFPAPQLDSGNDSLSSYISDYSMFVKVFEKTSQESFSTSEKLINEVCAARNIIPVINEDGTSTNNFLRVELKNCRGIDRGVVQIEVRWKSRKRFKREEVEKINNLNLNEVVNDG